MNAAKQSERKARARKLVAYLKKAYPAPKTELHYKTPMQLLAAVMLSAQTTDKQVNKIAATLFKKYKTPRDFAHADPKVFEKIGKLKDLQALLVQHLVIRDLTGDVGNRLMRPMGAGVVMGLQG